MPVPNCERYNLVILPLSPAATAGNLTQRFELSAGRIDRGARLVSPPWTESEIRAALSRTGMSPWQVDQLFRGNRMTIGGRDARNLSFDRQELLGMGLAPFGV